jgi:hypothetical protein
MATNAGQAQPMTIDRARTGDDLLSALAGIPRDSRSTALGARRGAAWLRIMREAVDLCGTDSTGYTYRDCIQALLEGF